MPIPPSNRQISTRVVQEYTIGKGLDFPKTTSTQQTSSLPVTNPPVLLGVDSISFTLSSTTPTNFGFSNIPFRVNNGSPAIPLTADQKALHLNPLDLILLDLALQNSASWVQFAGYALASDGTSHPGPFISGGPFNSFGVTITGTAGQSGIIVAKLYLQRQ